MHQCRESSILWSFGGIVQNDEDGVDFDFEKLGFWMTFDSKYIMEEWVRM